MKKRLLPYVLAAQYAVASPTFAQLLPGTPSPDSICCDTQCANFTAMIDLVSKLSDDIGLMADRIGLMADRIGEFGDRIVVTEELMANLVLELAELNANGDAAGGNGNVVLLTPFGTVVGDSQVPPIETINPLGSYLLFASPEINMGPDAVSVLIRDQADLEVQWQTLRAVSKDGHTLYIALKAIEGNSVSSLSNVVLLNLQ